MKKKLEYRVADRTVEREYHYIPFRYILAILIAVFEVAAIIGIVVTLCYYVPYFYLLCWMTEIACVVNIAASDDNPDFKVPWLLVVMVLPIAGFMLYFLFYSRKLTRKFVKRLQALKEHSYHRDDRALLEQLRRENPAAAAQAGMLCRIAEAHLFTDTAQTYFPLGEDLFPRLLADLRGAERFIYMEYFIIEEGRFWNSILDVLKAKAAEGVDVKVVYDDIGCMMTLPGDYWKTLRGYGIQATPFSRLRGNADKLAMIGTINLDYRSLVHHFENGVWMYRCDSIRDLRADMEDTLEKCIRITPDMLRLHLPQRIVNAVVRIFAPML